MEFDPTPLDITTLLVVALAMMAMFHLFKRRYESNLPLLFYAATVLLTSLSDRGLNAYLLYSGLAFALLVRFEFMGKGFAKFVGFLATSSIGLIAFVFLMEVFGAGPAPF